MTANGRPPLVIWTHPITTPGRAAHDAAVLTGLQGSRRVRQPSVQPGQLPPTQIPALFALRTLGINRGHLYEGGSVLELRQYFSQPSVQPGQLPPTQIPALFALR